MTSLSFIVFFNKRRKITLNIFRNFRKKVQQIVKHCIALSMYFVTIKKAVVFCSTLSLSIYINYYKPS